MQLCAPTTKSTGALEHGMSDNNCVPRPDMIDSHQAVLSVIKSLEQGMDALQVSLHSQNNTIHVCLQFMEWKKKVKAVRSFLHK